MFSWCTSISTSYFRSNLIPNWATLHVGTEHHLPPPSARQGSTSTFPPSRTNTSWESPRKLGCNHAPIWMDMGILCVYIYIDTQYIYICRYSIHLRPQLIPMMPFIFHPHFACRNFSATKLPTVLGQHFFHRLTLVNSPALAERRVVPVASSHLFTSLHSFISLLMSIDLCSTKHYQTLFHSWTLRKILSLAAGRVAKFANWWKWCRLVSRPFTSERPHLIRITGMDRWRTVIQGGDIGSCSLVTWPLRWFWGNIL